MSRISFRKQAADAKKKEKRQRKQKNAMNESRPRSRTNPNSRRKIQMLNYSVVPDYLVNRRARDVAESASCIACEKLAIKQPQLSWIVEVEHGEKWFSERIYGYRDKAGQAIFIHRDCSPFEIATTVAHETKHAWQVRNPRWFPVPNTTYTRGLTRLQKERDCKIFELEFWNGRKKRNGSFDDILRILTDMRIASARAQVQAISPQYAFKPQRGLPYSSSAHYPSQVKTRLNRT
jgi:hypothetical protein